MQMLVLKMIRNATDSAPLLVLQRLASSEKAEHEHKQV